MFLNMGGVAAGSVSEGPANPEASWAAPLGSRTEATREKNPRRSKGLDALGQALTLDVTACHRVEAAGIEPSDNFDATSECQCNCENCQQCRAANALHSGCIKRHLLASFDIDLQCLIERWERLDVSVRQAIAAYCNPSVVAVSP